MDSSSSQETGETGHPHFTPEQTRLIESQAERQATEMLEDLNAFTARGKAGDIPGYSFSYTVPASVPEDDRFFKFSQHLSFTRSVDSVEEAIRLQSRVFFLNRLGFQLLNVPPYDPIGFPEHRSEQSSNIIQRHMSSSTRKDLTLRKIDKGIEGGKTRQLTETISFMPLQAHH